MRDLSHYEAVELIGQAAPDRHSSLSPVQAFHADLNLTTWLDEARDVMRKRNAYLHGYWLPPEDERGVAGYWDKHQKRIDVDLSAITAEVERAELVERGGVSVLRYAGEVLGVPSAAEREPDPDRVETANP